MGGGSFVLTDYDAGVQGNTRSEHPHGALHGECAKNFIPVPQLEPMPPDKNASEPTGLELRVRQMLYYAKVHPQLWNMYAYMNVCMLATCVCVCVCVYTLM